MGLFNFKKTKYDSKVLYAPTDGDYIALENVEDKVFSQKIMGDGFAIEPKNGTFVSPVSGELVTVFPTMHAYGIKTEDGKEVLIHIGIDTVSLNGHGFSAKVKQGQKVKTGDVLVKVDLEAVKQAGYPITTMVIITSQTPFHLVKESDALHTLDAVLAFE